MSGDLSLVVGQEGSSGKRSDWPQLRAWQWANLLALLANIGFGVGVSFLMPSNSPNELQPALFYLQPAIYAFSIWLVIYATEFVFVLWQLVQKPGEAPHQRLAAIQMLAPWWCAAHAFTVGWMFLVRTTWLAAVGLSGVAVCLGVAHGAVAGETGYPDYYTMALPFTLHFGWGTAAALVTWNILVAESTTSVSLNLAALFASLALAGGIGSYFALKRRSPGLLWTLAWAVVGVAMMTLFPHGPQGAQYLAKYNAELGETGRYMLGGTELAVGLLLVVRGVRIRQLM